MPYEDNSRSWKKGRMSEMIKQGERDRERGGRNEEF
jgi:hypothetical protein